MTIHAAGASDVGRQRSVNEDYFAIVELTGNRPGVQHSQRERILGGRGGLFVVADGIGGAADGEIASEMAANVVQFRLTAAWRDGGGREAAVSGEDLRVAIEAANREIHAYAVERGQRGMGTTVAAAMILDGQLHVAHVGDSRAYLVRDKRLEPLTRDQSLVQHLVDAGHLTALEAFESDQRHVLIQALGPEPEVAVDVAWRRLEAHDVVVLCSDGLWSHVSDDEMATIILAEPDLAAAAERLVAAANERGGADNITVVLARVARAGD
jgi:protein phosphatase